HPTWLNLDATDLDSQPASAPDVAIHPEQLAYLILTSGSTGKPKSVAVAHGALVRHCQAIADNYAMQQNDIALHFAAFTFDAAMEQWLVPLINGCRLVIRDELWSAEQAYRTLLEQGVTWFEMPPAYLTEIARWAEQQGLALPLRACSVGGEAVSKDSLAQIRRVVGDAPIVNGYGPTETLITPLVWIAQSDTVCDTAYAPIGTGVGERTLYILDKDINPLPVGAVGELYIGGPCLARGYHGRPDLTAERFIPDPFVGDGGRLYRTGDLVRFRADGNVDYFGRGDHQIKLRGYRIELGEIEAQVLSHPAIAEAVVVEDGEGSDKRLVVYAANSANLAAEQLKQYLQSRLPDYMVPSQTILLERLPRLTSGKLDRRALPKPEWTANENFRAPQTLAECALAKIWQEILGIGRVGIDDNFFELGGDSILSIRLVSRARQVGWLFTPRDLFLHQTVASLAAAAQPVLKTAITAAPVAGEVALTPIQAQFFLDEIPNRQHWNLSLLLQTRQPLDEAKLECVLQTLICHHDSLRLRYRQENGTWRQYYTDIDAGKSTELLWRRSASDNSEVESIANQTQRSLDLQNGPLLRAVLIRVADGSQRLLLVVHHLVVDGVSWRILLEDLQNLYHDSLPLPAKTDSFKHWSQQLQNYAGSEALNQQLPYWSSLADASELPRDFPQDVGSFANACTLSLSFSTETTRQLLQQAPAAYRTRVNDLLLTALVRVLCRWSGRERVLVELESHGREDIFDDTDLIRSVGWFTSLYPVCLTSLAEPGASIKSVKETLCNVPDRGLGFGVLKYLAVPELRAQLAALPQPRVGFNYFGQLETEQALFTVAPETAGDDRDRYAPLPYWLEINAQVLGGELEIRWRYSEKQYRSATVKGLLDDYHNELTALVGHCLSGVKGATPSDFPLSGLSQPQIDALPIAIGDVEDIYPLAPMQQGILFHALLEPEMGVYVNQMTLDIDGLDVGRFAAAWRKAIARHDILRSAFIWRGETDRPLQVVYNQVALPLEIRDWRDHEDSDSELAALAAEEHAHGFDLAQAPLMRLVLVRQSEQSYRWIWTSHHILLDGWSTSQLLGEVLQSYAGNDRSIGSRYRDFIAWLQLKNPGDSESFWRQRLANLDEPTLLAAALGRVGGAVGHGNVRERLDAATTQRLQAFAQRQRITLNTLLQGAWALLLQRYCGQNRVAFGVTVSGRPAELPGVDNMLGLFINTVPLIVGGQPRQSVGDWLRRLQDDNLALREHEQTPLYDIQRWAGQAGTALFDSLLVFENFPVDAALRNADAGLQFGLPAHIDTTHYPLTLNVSIGESLGLGYGYWRDCFDADTVQKLDRHFRQLLLSMIEDAECPVANLHLLTEGARRQLLDWNSTAKAYPSGLIHELISRRAVAQPDAIALAFDEQTLGYGELERQANRLAHYLISLGVGPEMPVGIAIERSLALVIGLLAIIKAGGAYVPLDPDYPADRLAYMIADSGIGLLLSHTRVLQTHVDFGNACHCLNLDDLEWVDQLDAPPRPLLHPESPAYIIYTSGSTGRPKGAANSHAALANRLHWMQDAYPIGPGDTVLQKTPFSFDVSVWEFFWPLMTGARLVIAGPGDHRDPAALARLLLKHRVSTVHFVPAMLAEFVNQPELPRFPSLKRLVCSGEALPGELQQRVFQRLPGVELDNLYGPTEAAID
ncbi:MAG: condensation domain-containing protein, partial [Aquabacterium sp.]|uniref:condensation domain-containing protein n=1 Tax=Aquabacterium sp. TaxID=1872578 RepID=UPI0027216BEF